MSRRFSNALGINVRVWERRSFFSFLQIKYAGRRELAWTASAIAEHHSAEARALLEETFA